jgi:hypothetical protein
MKKHIFIIFLSVALFQGFLFAKSVRLSDIPDSNTLTDRFADLAGESVAVLEQPKETPIESFDDIAPSTPEELAINKAADEEAAKSSISVVYQDEDVLISFNRSYRETEATAYFCVELKLKIVANNKFIRPYSFVREKEVLDNFGNDLQYIGTYPISFDSLRPGDEKLFTIKFRIKPLENTKYLLLKIPSGSLGNRNPFELKIANPVFEPQRKLILFEDIQPTPATPEELDRMAESERWEKEREREANKRLFIESVVSLLVITICTICIIWLFISKRKIIKLFIKKRPHLIPAIIAAIMLFGALGQWSDDYYQLLRFVTCCVSVYVAYTAYTWQKMWVVWLFGFIAVLFNPLAPIHFSRELWQYVNIICAVLFAVVAFILRKPAEEK